MHFGRLRAGEWIVGVGALGLLVANDVVLRMSCVWRAGDDEQAQRLLDTVIGALRAG